MKAPTEFDIAIVGGGLSGLTLATALASSALRIALIDAKAKPIAKPIAKDGVNLTDKDLRAIALSYVSQQTFTNLDLWNELKKTSAPIKHVHISDRGHFGFVRIHARDYCLPNVGAVVPMQNLLDVLGQKVATCPNVTLIDSAQLLDTEIDDAHRTLTISQNNKTLKLQCKLAVAADGTPSKLRNLLNIKTKVTDYQQAAIVANIGVHRSHDGTAYERFTKTGPLAMLPISENIFSLVWTLEPKKADKIKELNEHEFLQQLQQAFGYRLGRFVWAGERQCFPLKLLTAEKVIADRAVILGNAAHTLHPIAGQGFNLGLRDIAVLAEQLEKACQETLDIGRFSILNTYQKKRENDVNKTIRLTDTVVKLFSNNVCPQNLLRNLALIGLDLTPLKNKLAFRSMGFDNVLSEIMGNK